MADLGVIGLGTMGSNLALNARDHDLEVAVWNQSEEKTAALVEREGGRGLVPCRTLESLVAALEPPRRILMMIKAGEPVDDVLNRLAPLLDKDDVVIDGGNSHFQDTRRRERELSERGLHFVGMGVSGGEEGARHGPSLMPGGSLHSYRRLEAVLKAIAAKTDKGPCVTWVGTDGAGHFVKMVHNGIEYGEMQLIAETWALLQRGLGLTAVRAAEVFERWNQGQLASFLGEITAKILRVRDPLSGVPLIDRVEDRVGQKGTGRWTVAAAVELGVPVPTIAAAVDVRELSARRDERIATSKKVRGPTKKGLGGDPERRLQQLHDALLFGRACGFVQGFALIRAAAEEFKWHVDLKEIARIWTGGCIIRCAFLDVLIAAASMRKPPANLLAARDVTRVVRTAQRGARAALTGAVAMGIPAPALAASLSWFDTVRSAELPTSLVAAQRDAFGAHGYLRVDQPEAGPQHTDWLA